MIREPIVAGQFYPGARAALQAAVSGYLAKAGPKSAGRTLLAMVPHAGYVYSGGVAGLTLGAANLASRVILLGPNHTGQGQPLALWSEGAWRTPAGDVPVDAELAAALAAAEPRLRPDVSAHLGEHSLEALLPFLIASVPGLRVTPVAVAEPRLEVLSGVAANMAVAIAAVNEPVSIVVSSDMSHYLSETRARELDALALERVAALDPQGLYRVVKSRGISMCGVLPMTLGLYLAKLLGATGCEIAAYDTSATASGDRGRVVGYAGALAG
ncbi:MAG: AmmeMemoRadiSam system protein B [Desulfovibrionaceae bacterium]|nr:AmmeMemoRadiSam system protein B [Desulfovibrionaceae bacterium]MBF0514685.1 AmmeMemoRadiSam system protein B [Desulfovibrionaceae bacterium]